MTDITESTIALEKAIERLRQERETFNQTQAQEQKWFSLRLRMGYVAVFLLPLVILICCAIIFNPIAYGKNTVLAATGVLFSDVVGLLISIWKVVLSPNSVTKLNPVTAEDKVGKTGKGSPRVLPKPAVDGG